MDFCANCEQPINSRILECKFCLKYFCTITCLLKHSSFHSKSQNPNSLVSTLKKKQTKEETLKYPFITTGIFTDHYKYNPEYDLSNFKRELDGFFPVELGVGAFAHVYLVTHKYTKKKYALKIINKHKLIQAYGDCNLIYNEIEIHSKLNHRNIIRLYNKQETEDEIQILLEYAEKGNLFNLIQKSNGLDEFQAYQYFIQTVNAVHFLHQNNIIHRDIKPENILLGENGLVKLCDFGWAKELTINKRSTFCGTMEYMAPEIVESEKYDFSVDVWSLGILLYELIMGHSPFRAERDANIMVKIKLHDLVFDKNKNISTECINLINGLLDPNPTNRLKLKDIFNHCFIKKYSKEANQGIFSPRKESLDDSNENIIKFFNRNNVEERVLKLKQKFGFDNKLNLKDKLSSKNLFVVGFQSDKKIISLKEKKESMRLKKLMNQMSDEVEKAKKKVDNLNFKSAKQFSFEDFRDSEILNNNDRNVNESLVDNKVGDTKDDILYDTILENDDRDSSFEEVKE